MRRWNVRATLSTARPRPIPPLRRTAASHVRLLTTAPIPTPGGEKPSPPSQSIRRITIFDRIGRPERCVEAWAALLDGALPPHLRDWSKDASPPALSAVDLANVLIEAQHPRNPEDEPFDLLYHLGFNEGRWNAVVWLVKKLIQKFPVRHGRASRLAKVNALWEKTPSLDEALRSPLELATSGVPKSGVLKARTLDDLTSGPAENHSTEEILAHDALGQIWRTLGNMTKACAGGEIRPEVLEIIAFLHHQEIMPMSIYQSERNPDGSAIQQPPLLSLLSSRILTSLSDAAWRAHEKIVVEEAKAMGGEYADLRPEVPGSVYRVRVAGLRPEVWLELILWSCLRGGWILPGADILRSIAQDKQWKTLSWKDYEHSIPAEDRSTSTTWADWEYVFKTRKPDTPSESNIQTSQAVSAEIVNAYIDALASSVSVGVGRHGVEMREIIPRLQELKSFLRRRGLRVTLSTGSWDALILRLIDSQGNNPEHDAATIRQLVALSPGFGVSKEIGASNTQDLPAYVLDGNMAMHGLLNMALRGQIAAGSFEGALAVFNQIEHRINLSRNVSLEDFLGVFTEFKQKLKTKHKNLVPPQSQVMGMDEMFTSNFAGIEHPELKIQIPPTTLARFLELATDVKAYDFGKFLLHRDDVESGPLIGPELYEDRYIQPALIRFATEAEDQILLAKIQDLNLRRESFQAVLSTQIAAHKWDAAGRVMDHLAQTSTKIPWEVHQLALLMQIILRSRGSKNLRESDRSVAMLDDMLNGHYAGRWPHRHSHANGVRNLAVVFSAIGHQWANMCAGVFEKTAHLSRTFDLPSRSFNIVLEGVVATLGVVAGQKLLNTFWSPATRRMHATVSKLRRYDDKRGMLEGARFSPEERIEKQRIVVNVPGLATKDDEVVVYGSLIPNTETIMIILRHALTELTGRSSATEGSDELRKTITWAVRRLAELPYVEASIVEQLSQTLTERGLHDLVPELPEMVRIVEDDLLLEDDNLAEIEDASGDIGASINTARDQGGPPADTK